MKVQNKTQLPKTDLMVMLANAESALKTAQKVLEDGDMNMEEFKIYCNLSMRAAIAKACITSMQVMRS